MALKPCVECKREISSSAKVCPHCGHTDPHHNELHGRIFMVLACFGGLAFLWFKYGH